MTSQTAQKIAEKIDDLREEIEELQRQKDKLQEVYDFADFIETHDLINQEIERLRRQLLQEKERLASRRSGRDETAETAEKEEENASPLPRRYNIEHAIRDSEGLRAVRSEDIYMDKNKAVRETFETFNEWQKQKYREKTAEKSRSFSEKARYGTR